MSFALTTILVSICLGSPGIIAQSVRVITIRLEGEMGEV